MEKMTKSNSGIRFYLVDFFSFVLLILPLLPFAKDYYFICIVLYILLNFFFRRDPFQRKKYYYIALGLTLLISLILIFLRLTSTVVFVILVSIHILLDMIEYAHDKTKRKK